MSTNKKVTSQKVASQAGRILRSNSTSQTAKSLAASALSQRQMGNQTGGQIEDPASKVLVSSKYSRETKTIAGSVLAQANKER